MGNHSSRIRNKRPTRSAPDTECAADMRRCDRYGRCLEAAADTEDVFEAAAYTEHVFESSARPMQRMRRTQKVSFKLRPIQEMRPIWSLRPLQRCPGCVGASCNDGKR